MQSLVAASRMRTTQGEPLPVVWDQLARNDIHIRQGELVLIAAASGVGKSVFSLAYAIRSKAPSLYFSMDTPARTVTVRSVQMVADCFAREAEELLEDPAFLDRLAAETRHVEFVWASGIEMTEIAMRVLAYAEKWGTYPACIFIDNIRNCHAAGETQQRLNSLMEDFQQLTRKTGSAVVVMHHVTGQFGDGLTPVPLNGVEYQLHKLPDTVLALTRDDKAFHLLVCPVKLRAGKADPSGQGRIPIPTVLARMQIGD